MRIRSATCAPKAGGQFGRMIRELLAADAGGQVHRAHRGSERIGDRLDDEVAGDVADRVARSGEPACADALDIASLQAHNDRHGHVAGDFVIKAVADALAASVRPMDLAARIGGEEFAIILPNCPPAFGRRSPSVSASRSRTRRSRCSAGRCSAAP